MVAGLRDPANSAMEGEIAMRSGTTIGRSVFLDWPEERAGGNDHFPRWLQPVSNIGLDFHGDPVNAELVVFSDGNHHMALRDCLDLFVPQNAALSDIFYVTTPPGPIVAMLKAGGLRMGNLVISVAPHVFISPPEILDALVTSKHLSGHTPFVRNQGNVLLVRKGNPKRVLCVSDLGRDDVRLFLSSPDAEKVSYKAYSDTLKALTSEQHGPSFLNDKIRRNQVLFGQCIHHREAPQALADGAADAAMVFYHLALRYMRIFPGLFEMVPLGGEVEKPLPLPGNVICQTNLSVVGDGGAWGQKLAAFLGSEQAMEIYRYHGLLPSNQA